MNDRERAYDIFFFDLDGTLTDSSLGITNSVIYALKKFGIEETDRTKLYPFIGPPLTVSFGQFYGFSKEQCIEAVGYYREYYRDRGLFENHVYEGLENVLKELKKLGKRLVVTSFDTDNDYFDVDLSADIALVIGNEGNGVSQELMQMADVKVKIPMEGRLESLNASVAAGILMYERCRGRAK